MPKFFGFSHRRKKLGRLKVHLGEPVPGNRSPVRPSKRLSHSNEENEVLTSSSGRIGDHNCNCSSHTFDLQKCSLGSLESWKELPTYGDKPTPRFNHAAAVVGSKMVVVGGESNHGLLDDTVILSLDKLNWAATTSNVCSPPTGISPKIPACKGHSLVSWGKSALLVGGKTDPPSDKLSVWSFDVERECWSHIEAKGNIPVARSGHTIVRAGTVLILFGGEDVKGRKLNDLYMFDLKSLSWLPLHYKGTGPSARSNHVASLYKDKLLFVFGGQSKSRILNDLYSLDFETMIWSKVKVRGHHPSPRAGCCGALCGTKWYITGGGSKRKRHAETLIFDVLKLEWTTSVISPSSVITNRGFSLLPVHHKDKNFLLAFGGYKKEPSNQVEVLFLVTNEHSMSWRSAPDMEVLDEEHAANIKEFGAHLKSISSPTPSNLVARHSLASALEQQIPGRKSISDDPLSTGTQLSKQFPQDQDYGLATKIQKPFVDEKYETDNHLVPSNRSSQRSKRQEAEVKMDIAGILASTEEMHAESEGSNIYHKQERSGFVSDAVPPLETDGRSVLTNPSNIYQLYETRIASSTRKNVLLEEQLKAALTSQEAAEKNLSSAARSKQEIEKKLADSLKEIELLREKLAGVELAQEEANSLSNIVHSDNVRLEHDVAFLKAILDDTQKELHSTRGVLAAERARAFQLQVEVFHLKQRLQSIECRAPTPRKPFPI
ncbi:acyl-CoA-binding domain-containing protein 4 [Canna indica]|uniref:Acyl-CoA-binding domain-containing protein 4 n=1 Tax=Canna indica TaxID=4628 RepID=A0AAQ3K7F6_9LILI|nr:acyl-CoA-binding domain-containing protein 4 [Canna indica]